MKTLGIALLTLAAIAGGYFWGKSNWKDERKADVTVASPKQALTPLVSIVEGGEIDLALGVLTSDEIAGLKELDSAGGIIPREIATPRGVFKEVFCEGRLNRTSVNYPHKEGFHKLLKLPNGKLVRPGFWPDIIMAYKDSFELDGDTYLFGGWRMFKVVSPEKLRIVLTFSYTGSNGLNAPSIWGAVYANRYVPVIMDEGRLFGLLDYSGGKWSFHEYGGMKTDRVKDVSDTDAGLLISSWDGRAVIFNKAAGEFAN